MEETNKSPNQQKGNNKMLIKIGGGGIGAVVLFGGALATAAFASVFVLGQKRRSSGKDRRHNSSPDIDEKSEEDEDQTFREHESEGAREEIEMEKDSTVMISAHSLKEDDEKQGDVEAREVENDAFSVDGFVVVKEEIPLLAEKDEIQIIKEEFSKEITNPEIVSVEDEIAERESDGDVGAIEGDKDIEGVKSDEIKDDKNVSMEAKMEEREFGGFCDGSGQIKEEKAVEVEAIDRDKVDLNGDGIDVVSESHNADGDEPLLHLHTAAVNGCIANPPKNHKGENGEVGECLEVDAKMSVEKKVVTGLETVEYGENEEAGLNENGEAAIMQQHPDSHEKEERLGESNWEALWQAEWPKAAPQQVKVMSYQVGGKVQEDIKGTFLQKYQLEMGTVKDHSTSRGIMIWMLCVLSSLSCSWFFGLSCAKICLVVFLSVFLLEIYGYPLVNRKRDQCLHAVKGEATYL